MPLPFCTIKGATNKGPFLIGVPQSEAEKYNRIIDLDVDIGAEAVDYKYVLTHFTPIPIST
jgi:hypothetical protein